MKRRAVPALRSYAAGAAVAIIGFLLAKMPTWIVASGTVSLFDLAREEAPLMHVIDGCEGSAWAIKSYREDAALRAAAIPITPQPRDPEAQFYVSVCTLALDALVERGYWWVRLVERDVGCRSLWEGERDFLSSHKVLAWPQFTSGDTVIKGFDREALRSIGVEKVMVGDRRILRGIRSDEF